MDIQPSFKLFKYYNGLAKWILMSCWITEIRLHFSSLALNRTFTSQKKEGRISRCCRGFLILVKLSFANGFDS